MALCEFVFFAFTFVCYVKFYRASTLASRIQRWVTLKRLLSQSSMSMILTGKARENVWLLF